MRGHRKASKCRWAATVGLRRRTTAGTESTTRPRCSPCRPARAPPSTRAHTACSWRRSTCHRHARKLWAQTQARNPGEHVCGVRCGEGVCGVRNPVEAVCIGYPGLHLHLHWLSPTSSVPSFMQTSEHVLQPGGHGPLLEAYPQPLHSTDVRCTGISGRMSSTRDATRALRSSAATILQRVRQSDGRAQAYAHVAPIHGAGHSQRHSRVKLPPLTQVGLNAQTYGPAPTHCQVCRRRAADA